MSIIRALLSAPAASFTGAVALACALASPSGGCAKYDQLIAADQGCEQAWADVEAQLQRRYG